MVSVVLAFLSCTVYRDIMTLSVHTTACDLDKCFTFHTTVEITGRTYDFRFMSKRIIGNTCYLSRYTEVRMVSNR